MSGYWLISGKLHARAVSNCIVDRMLIWDFKAVQMNRRQIKAQIKHIYNIQRLSGGTRYNCKYPCVELLH